MAFQSGGGFGFGAGGGGQQQQGFGGFGSGSSQQQPSGFGFGSGGFGNSQGQGRGGRGGGKTFGKTHAKGSSGRGGRGGKKNAFSSSTSGGGFGFGSPSSSPPSAQFGFGSSSPPNAFGSPPSSGGKSGFLANAGGPGGFQSKPQFGSKSNQWHRQPQQQQQQQQQQSAPSSSFTFGGGSSASLAQSTPTSGFGFGGSGSGGGGGGFGGAKFGASGASQKGFGPSSDFDASPSASKAAGGGSFSFGKKTGSKPIAFGAPSQPSTAGAAGAATPFSTSAPKAKVPAAAPKKEKRSFTWVNPALRTPQKAAPGGSQQKPPSASSQDKVGKLTEMERLKREAISKMPKFGGGGGTPAKPKPMMKKATKKAETEMERLKREAISKMPAFAGGTAKPSSAKKVQKPLKKTPHASQVMKASSTPLVGAEASGSGADPHQGEEGGGIVGTCELMCPMAELEKKYRTNDFDDLEIPTDDMAPGTSVEDLAVKRFARTITEEDRTPDRLRTRGALARTMKHLLGLMDSKRTTFEKVHRFLWDRYRAIRTDLSIQHIKDKFAVQCYEEMIRFHIIAEHELCEETASVTNPHGFNSHLNVEQMYKCLTSLFSLYDELAKAGTPCANEPEFRAYYLLLTMDTHGKYRRDNSAHTFALSKMRTEILHSHFVRFAVQLNSLYHEGNFVKFFQVVRRSPFLVSCILHAYFNPARAKALKLFSQGVYGRKRTLAVGFVQGILLVDSEEGCAELLQSFGLLVRQDAEEGCLVLVIGGRNFEEKEDNSRTRSAFIASLREERPYSEHCRGDANLFKPTFLPKGGALASAPKVRLPKPAPRPQPLVKPAPLISTPAMPTPFETPREPPKKVASEAAPAPLFQAPQGSPPASLATPKTFPSFPIGSGGDVGKKDVPPPLFQPTFLGSDPAASPPQFQFGQGMSNAAQAPAAAENSKRRRQKSVSPNTGPLTQSKKMLKSVDHVLQVDKNIANISSPLADFPPPPAIETPAQTSFPNNFQAPEAAAAAQAALETKARELEMEESRIAAQREAEKRERERLERERREKMQRRLEQERRLLRERRERRIREVEQILKQAFVDLVHRRLLALRMGRMWRQTAKIIVTRRKEALKKCSLSTAILNRGISMLSVGRADEEAIGENASQDAGPTAPHGAAVAQESDPGADSGGDGAVEGTRAGFREVLPSEALMEEVTTALRAARDMSPHMVSFGLSGMLNQILNEWIETIESTEIFGRREDLVSAKRSLQELKTLPSDALSPATCFEHYARALAQSEALSKPLMLLDRKPLSKFELCANLHL